MQAPPHWGHELDQQRLGKVQHNMPTCDKPVRIHCETGSLSTRLALEMRAKSQDFMARCRDDGIPDEIDSPFVAKHTNIAVRLCQSLEDQEIFENNLRPCGKFGPKSSKFSSLKEMTTGAFIVPALDARAQVLSIKERRNSVGNQVFKLISHGNGQLFAFTAPDLRIPGIPDGVLQQVISQARTANV